MTKDVEEMDTRFIKFTKYVLDIMYFGGFVVLITLPATIKFLGKYYSAVITKNFALMLFVFGISGILGILIIGQLRRMLRTVIKDSCFVYGNVESLHKMAMMSIGIVIMFIFKLFFVPTPATGIIILVFFIAALFSQVLADVFEKAVNYKEENDLTI